MNIRLKDKMSEKLFFARPEDSVKSAYKTMQENRIRHLPVINTGREVVGIISDRDLQRVIDSATDALVKHYMTWPVLTTDVDSDLSDVAKKMIDSKVSSLIVTENETVVGLVTHEDLLRILCEMLKAPEGGLKTTLRRIAYDPTLNYVTQAVADIGI